MKKSTRLQTLCLVILSLSTLAHLAKAGSATWNLNPTSGDWNTAVNWTPNLVPDETATFGVSNTTGVSVSQFLTYVGRIYFAPGASSYTITPLAGSSLVINGSGVANKSRIDQNFLLSEEGGELIFFDGASAGDHSKFTTTTIGLQFQIESSAGTALIENLGGTATTPGGFVGFYDRSKAEGAGINNYGGEVSGARGGWAYFTENSSAGNAHINCYGGEVNGALGGLVQFVTGNTHASNAVLTAYGGSNGAAGGVIQFLSRSQGESCRVVLFDNGTLDVSQHTGGADVDIGSLDGDGIVALGGTQLTIGTNNLNTGLRGGLIEDGPRGSGGSLRKVGSGTLTIVDANTYTGGTVIDQGKVLVLNGTGSATGTGPVQVNGGTMGGDGIIGGPVTVGAVDSEGAFLQPQDGLTLTIEGSLLFTSNSIYRCPFLFEINAAHTVVANGVTIEGNARFFSVYGGGKHHRRMSVGTVLTVINNTADTPIGGTFSNLPEGRIFREALNKFQATYFGGDGNDLTLTVVP